VAREASQSDSRTPTTKRYSTKRASEWRTRFGQGYTFEYMFDFGDEWMHECSVVEDDLDPTELFDEEPTAPVSIWGWGQMPDQDGRTAPDD
jgi:hypothetical protein